jgi:hypothetical protein
MDREWNRRGRHGRRAPRRSRSTPPHFSWSAMAGLPENEMEIPSMARIQQNQFKNHDGALHLPPPVFGERKETPLRKHSNLCFWQEDSARHDQGEENRVHEASSPPHTPIHKFTSSTQCLAAAPVQKCDPPTQSCRGGLRGDSQPPPLLTSVSSRVHPVSHIDDRAPWRCRSSHMRRPDRGLAAAHAAAGRCDL